MLVIKARTSSTSLKDKVPWIKANLVTFSDQYELSGTEIAISYWVILGERLATFISSLLAKTLNQNLEVQKDGTKREIDNLPTTIGSLGFEKITTVPWFEIYSRWKWSTYLVCTVWASGKLLMRRDHLTPENNISSDSARNSVITCNYVKLRHVSHTPEHGNIARRAEGSWFLSSWYDVPLSLSAARSYKGFRCGRFLFILLQGRLRHHEFYVGTTNMHAFSAAHSFL